MQEQLKPYITELMKAAHDKGTPPMRPLFYDFPEDKECWNIEDEYMFGPNILVAPILFEGLRDRNVYLPTGVKWKNANTGRLYEGGQWIKCSAALDVIPLFFRDNAKLQMI